MKIINSTVGLLMTIYLMTNAQLNANINSRTMLSSHWNLVEHSPLSGYNVESVVYYAGHRPVITNKKMVWVDTDLTVGMKCYYREGFSDVDDGYAVLQLFKADNIHITGISAVFGNTKIDDAYRLCKKMVSDFSGNPIPVHKGAGEKIDLVQVVTIDAVEAMAEALRKEPQTILAIGPANNVGLLLLLYPELAPQIQEVVLVAGRRTPTSYFEIGNPVRHAPDLNFNLDNEAFRILFQREIKVVLCPFEISNKVWLTAEDLKDLQDGTSGNAWLTNASKPWLEQWVDAGDKGFNPFDVFASHYLIAPEDLIMEPLLARLEIHVNDMKLENKEHNFKQYLLCDKKGGYPILYCYGVVSDYHQKLMASLLKSN